MGRMKIAIIFGGCSPEHEISLKSAYGVATHMDSEKYEAVMLGITREGEWFHFSGPYEKILDGTWADPDCGVKAVISPDRTTQGVIVFEARGGRGWRSIELDAAMPVLHGKNGEDGTVQGLLELAGIPVVGCGQFASALCMDKSKAHKVAEANGICVARSFTVGKKDPPPFFIEKAEALGYPLFVKPVKAGSSFGITKVLDKDGLEDAVMLAFEYDDEAIVEECVPGFEIGCAVLGNDILTVGQIDEIELACDFLDYKEKYTPKAAKTHVPARIPEQKAKEAKDMAKRIYRALGCSGFARVDMFLTPFGEIVFNEVNTIPGFTSHSRYPNMLKAAGMPFGQMISNAIELAVGQ